jgi:SAM-dependent methyltransferase
LGAIDSIAPVVFVEGETRKISGYLIVAVPAMERAASQATTPMRYSGASVKFPDHFSSVAASYSTYRPQYPASLFAWLESQCLGKGVAWDCACGSGQATLPLAKHFERVLGTDASPNQVHAAKGSETTRFVVAAAEAAPIADGAVDLVTVAQALHWFATDAFFTEVRRVARSGCVFAAWTYGMPHIAAEEVEGVVHEFIDGPLGPYWPPEIRMVLDGYTSIDLPFEELKAPSFEIHLEWPLEKFLGFARTWSAVGRYVEARGDDPVVKLAADLDRISGNWRDSLSVDYRLKLRVGRV